MPMITAALVGVQELYRVLEAQQQTSQELTAKTETIKNLRNQVTELQARLKIIDNLQTETAPLQAIVGLLANKTDKSDNNPKKLAVGESHFRN